jgi:large subunit ribosomal protein L25
MEVNVINVSTRTEKGKGAARSLRRAGQIPAVAYDKGETPVQLALNPKELLKVLRANGRNSVFELQVDEGGSSFHSMIQELQRHPVSDDIMHVDFLRIGLDQAVTVKVNVTFSGRPVGVLRGGKTKLYHRKVTVTALPKDIPLSIEVDVSGMDLGDVFRVGDLPLPEGVTTADDYKKTALFAVLVPKNLQKEQDAA